jgi:beta-lactamase regulating signal transducer with metallopeptidase domain
MTQYFLYLIEASICITLLYLIFLLFIKDETFYKLKRVFLLTSVIISLVIPKLPSANWTREIQRTITPQIQENVSNAFSKDNFGRLLFESTSNRHIIEKKEQIAVLSKYVVFIYVLGVFFMFFRLANNFYQIVRLMMRDKHELTRKYRIVHLSIDYPTFSFFNYIFLNTKNLTARDQKDVMLHEEAHIKQGHSFDIIFIEICKILMWFNPVMWQIKNSLLKVHECLADESVIKSGSATINDYKELLLKQYLSNIKIELAHPFNYSLIKFRINMMTKTKSKWWAKYKLIFAIPIIILSLLAFSNDRLTSSTGEISLHTQLNQVELFRQFLGTWIFQKSKDTTCVLVCKPYNDGLDMYLKYESKGKIILEQKGLMDYDKISDKLIRFNTNPENPPYAMWFSSKYICEVGPIMDISNPSNVSPDRKWVFKSSDLLSLSILINDKYVDIFTLTREKY